MAAHQRPDGFGVKRVRVINHADAQHRRQAKRAGEPERMKNGRMPRKPIAAAQPKHLLQLFDVRTPRCSGSTSRPWDRPCCAGEDHGGQVIQTGFFSPRPKLAATNDPAPARR